MKKSVYVFLFWLFIAILFGLLLKLISGGQSTLIIVCSLFLSIIKLLSLPLLIILLLDIKNKFSRKLCPMIKLMILNGQISSGRKKTVCSPYL